MVARLYLLALAMGLMFAGCSEEEGPDTSCVYEFSVDREVDPAQFPDVEDFDALSCETVCQQAAFDAVISLERCSNSFEYAAMSTVPKRGHVTCKGEARCD